MTNQRNGIILDGGYGTRLHPVTQTVSKQLTPVYYKPMVFYPFSTLMLSDTSDVLLISTPEDTPRFAENMGYVSRWGVNMQYAVQPRPDGLIEAIIIGRDLLANRPSVLVSGDNIIYGHVLVKQLHGAHECTSGASVFAYNAQDTERYGLVEFDAQQRAISIEEQPKEPQINYAVTGLYFYDQRVCDIATDIKPSALGELEVTDVNRRYLEQGQLKVEIIGRGYAWLDTGTYESLLVTASFIATLQKGFQVACPEEILSFQDWINADQLSTWAESLKKTAMGNTCSVY